MSGFIGKCDPIYVNHTLFDSSAGTFPGQHSWINYVEYDTLGVYSALTTSRSPCSQNFNTKRLCRLETGHYDPLYVNPTYIMWEYIWLHKIAPDWTWTPLILCGNIFDCRKVTHFTWTALILCDNIFYCTKLWLSRIMWQYMTLHKSDPFCILWHFATVNGRTPKSATNMTCILHWLIPYCLSP